MCKSYKKRVEALNLSLFKSPGSLAVFCTCWVCTADLVAPWSGTWASHAHMTVSPFIKLWCTTAHLLLQKSIWSPSKAWRAAHRLATSELLLGYLCVWERKQIVSGPSQILWNTPKITAPLQISGPILIIKKKKKKKKKKSLFLKKYQRSRCLSCWWKAGLALYYNSLHGPLQIPLWL